MSRVLYVAVCSLFLAIPASAQLKAPTKRPKFPVGVDTNDASVYYSYGVDLMRRDPEAAADAFYWATRLNPGSAEALYARRVALILNQPNRLVRYWIGDKRTVQSKDILQIDSLYYRALVQNPFLYEKFERTIFDAMLKKYAEEIVGPGSSDAGEVEYYLQIYVKRQGPGQLAQIAYADGRFDDALKYWASAMKSSKEKAYYRIWRGKLFYQLGNVDSAHAEFNLALDELRKRDKKDLVFVYESKALLEQAVGMIYERKDSLNAAREAYGRALQEDLSYYPGHVRLGFLALTMKDTTTALSEMDLAVQIRGDEPQLRFMYGYTLSAAHKYADAETQLRKAAELEPLYAVPHAVLGELYDAQNKPDEALKSYRNFLVLAARSDPRRAQVEARVTALSSGKAGGGPQ